MVIRETLSAVASVTYNPEYMKRLLALGCLIFVLGGFALGGASCSSRAGAAAPSIARIGVLLPLTGDRPLDWERILDWQASSINSRLRPHGFGIELVYKDTFGLDISDLATELISDPSLQVAIGPMTSREAMRIAPQFERAKKLLISPCATSDELFKAFAGRRCFARTCQSDVAEVNTILNILRSQGTKRVSLIYENTTYGRTFQNWTGFFAREMGMELTDSSSFTPGQADMSSVVDQAVGGSPECVVLAAFPTDAENIMRRIDALEHKPRVFSTDAAMQPSFIKMRGEKAEGFEGMTPAGDPEAGFVKQYKDVFGHEPEAWSAETYDALTLAACASARSHFLENSQPFYDSFMDIVTGTSGSTGSTLAAVNSTLEQILSGGLPRIAGATGPLVFDRRYGVDTLDTFYAYWKVHDGEMRLERVISSDEVPSTGVVEPGAPTASALPSPQFMNYQKGMPTGQAPFTPRSDLWAVILASSYGLGDYRHQADALAIYGMLKARGVPDDRIILMITDDVRYDAGNTRRGKITDRLGGADLRKDAVVDYSGDEITATDFEEVLLGYADDASQPVLDSNINSDVLVYVAGNVSDGNLAFSGSAPLTARRFSQVVDKMHELGSYRQLLVLAQLTEGSDFCRFMTSPDAVAIAAASRGEAAAPSVFDSTLGVWLTDRFTSSFINTVSRSKSLSVADTYRRVYLGSGGAHVTLINYQSFDVEGTRIADFISP